MRTLLVLVLAGSYLGFEEARHWPGTGFVVMLSLVAVWAILVARRFPQLARVPVPVRVADERAAR